jgi:hypothetical protein
MCLVRRPSCTNPNLRYKAMAAWLWGKTLNVSLCSPRACADSIAAATNAVPTPRTTPFCGDHHPDLAEPEAALYDKEQSNGFAPCNRDQRPIQVPARCPLLNVDRRLSRDPVAFLCHSRKKKCQRTAITIRRGPNLDGCCSHAPILAALTEPNAFCPFGPCYSGRRGVWFRGHSPRSPSRGLWPYHLLQRGRPGRAARAPRVVLPRRRICGVYAVA